MLGDEGSGYWIGRRALAAVMRDADGRGPRTALTPLVLEHFSAAAPQELVARSTTAAGPPRDRLARRRSSSRRARRRRSWPPRSCEAADELALAAASVIARLEMRGEQFPILLAGGMFRAMPWLAAEVARAAWPRSRRAAPCALLTLEPAVGAVRLALAEARGGVRVPPYLDAVRATPSVNIRTLRR